MNNTQLYHIKGPIGPSPTITFFVSLWKRSRNRSLSISQTFVDVGRLPFGVLLVLLYLLFINVVQYYTIIVVFEVNMMI